MPSLLNSEYHSESYVNLSITANSYKQ